MKLSRLILAELSHRRLNVLIAIAAIATACTSVIATNALLSLQHTHSEQRIAVYQEELKDYLDEMNDDFRKITKKDGFNVRIFPKSADLESVHFGNIGKFTMPEEYASKLANSDLVSVTHLLPTLQENIKWPEQDRLITIIGTRNEVPQAHRNPRKAIQESIPKGHIALGHELHSSLKLKIGDPVTFMGQTFTLYKTHKERGTKEDLTAWLHLSEAQKLLNKQGLINVILALECKCAMADIGKVRKDIARFLPDTQVLEWGTKALRRMEARSRVSEGKKELVAKATAEAEAERLQLEQFAAILLPLIVIGALALVGFLTLHNVRERRYEIGVLRAIGLHSRSILIIILGKALIIGFCGGIVGIVVGYLIGNAQIPQAVNMNILSINEALALLIAAPCCALAAAWLPAVLAAQNDPAIILREE